MPKQRTKEQHEKEILKIIQKYRLFFIKDIFAYYKGCSRATFYNLGLDNFDTIKDALEDNRVTTCQSMKAKWAQSDNPTLQIGLYKILCSDDERRKLQSTYTDVTSNGKPLDNTIHVNIIDKTGDIAAE